MKATVTATILDANDQAQMIYLRYCEQGAASWSNPHLQIGGTETATREITTFMVSTTYDLQASLYSDFASPAETTFSIPDVIEVTVEDVTDESANAIVKIGEPGTAEKTVHLRYGPVSDDPGEATTKGEVGLGATETQTAMGQTPGDRAEIPVPNLIPDQDYVLEGSLDDGFERGVERITFRTEPAGAGSGGGGGGGDGGGGPPPQPVPSEADFTWNVTRDIDSLYGDNDQPTGIWGDGEALWVLQNATSGPDAIFVYDLETGERVEDREFELDRRNRFSHGTWCDGETMWISDSGRDLLFAYDIDTGERLPELDIELHEDNRDPRDIWSDGGVIYVVDDGDDKVYTYNLPDAIDARLASLSLSGIAIDEFSPRRKSYAAILSSSLTETTVQATAMQEEATVTLAPADADADPANGHQAAVSDGLEITVTVVSPDGSLTRVYRVSLGHCLTGLAEVGLSLVTYASGSLAELQDCAHSLSVDALYHYTTDGWTGFLPDRPDILSQPFLDRFVGGLAAPQSLIAKRDPTAITTPINGSPN